MKKLLLPLLFLCYLFSTVLEGAILLNIDQPIRTLKISDYQLKSAIIRAAQKQHWNIRDEKNNRLSATYYKSNYMAKINIRYAPSFYTIDYADSKRMRYDGRNIHPTYNRLIKALQATIIHNLKTGNYERKRRVLTSATCSDTFNVEGDIWSGHLYAASRHIKSTSVEELVRKSQTLITANGFVIDSISPEMGMINASQTKRNGHVYPLNLTFTLSGGGISANINISTPPGSSDNRNNMKVVLCTILNKLESNTNATHLQNDSDTSTPEESIKNKLIKIKRLYEDGLITEEEYSQKRRSLINSY